MNYSEMHLNSYGFTLLLVIAVSVCLTFIWNLLTAKPYKMSLDQAEEILIYAIAGFLLLTEVWGACF